MAEVRRLDFRTKAKIVFDGLKDRIVSGGLPPGARLTLKPIAEEFECSEIPVREAFRSLQAAGLIELVPHTGAFVAGIDVEALSELTEIRAILEPEATAAAVGHMDTATLATLRAMLDQMRKFAGRNAAADFGRINRQFHDLILTKCPNRQLAALVGDLWARADRGFLVYRNGAQFLQEALKQHIEILDAIESGDVETVRRRAGEHSRFGLEAVRSLLRAATPVRRAAAGGA